MLGNLKSPLSVRQASEEKLWGIRTAPSQGRRPVGLGIPPFPKLDRNRVWLIDLSSCLQCDFGHLLFNPPSSYLSKEIGYRNGAKRGMNQALIGVGCKDGVAGFTRGAVNVILPFDVMNQGSRAVVMRGWRCDVRWKWLTRMSATGFIFEFSGEGERRRLRI